MNSNDFHFAIKLKDCPQVSIQGGLDKIPTDSWDMVHRSMYMIVSTTMGMIGAEMQNGPFLFVEETS